MYRADLRQLLSISNYLTPVIHEEYHRKVQLLVFSLASLLCMLTKQVESVVHVDITYWMWSSISSELDTLEDSQTKGLGSLVLLSSLISGV